MSKFFNKVIDAEGFSNVHAIAIHLTNNKYFVCDKLESMEDWLDNLKTADETMDAYYLGSHLNTTMFEDYLNFKGETPLTMAIGEFLSNFKDLTLIITLMLIMVLNKFILKFSWKKNFLSAATLSVVLNVGLTIYNRYDDLF